MFSKGGNSFSRIARRSDQMDFASPQRLGVSRSASSLSSILATTGGMVRGPIVVWTAFDLPCPDDSQLPTCFRCPTNVKIT